MTLPVNSQLNPVEHVHASLEQHPTTADDQHHPPSPPPQAFSPTHSLPMITLGPSPAATSSSQQSSSKPVATHLRRAERIRRFP